MDATRIAELEREYDEGVERDYETLFQILSENRSILLADAVLADYCENILSSEDFELSSVHSLLDLMESHAPDVNTQLIDKIGRVGRTRLYWAYQHEQEYFERYLDRTYELPAGDYYITDPCYFNPGGWRWDEGIWYGEDLANWDIPTSYMRDTIFGDWSCSLMDSDTGEQLGSFCADAGLVVVALVDEVLEANPDFAQWADDHSWCVARINNFSGSFTYKVSESEYDWNGDTYTDYELSLEFDGFDARTGRPMRLIGGMGLE